MEISIRRTHPLEYWEMQAVHDYGIPQMGSDRSVDPLDVLVLQVPEMLDEYCLSLYGLPLALS